MWNDKFIEILKEKCAKLDAAIATILKDQRVSQLCATKIRSYVDKDVSAWLYAQRKDRGAKRKKQLQTAVEGLRAASDLCTELGKRESAEHLGKLVDEFSQALARCEQAFATKRHGRDRDHAILLECHSFLQAALKQPLTFATLANLVNAGYEADGNVLQEPVDEEQIRKNLASFKQNNPLGHLYVSAGQAPAQVVPPPGDPETK